MPDDVPGWRQDPTNDLQQRYYDGFKWTSSVRPLPTPGSPVDDTPPSRPTTAAPASRPTNVPRATSVAATYPATPTARPTRMPINYQAPPSRWRGRTIAVVAAGVVGLILAAVVVISILPATTNTTKNNVAVSQALATATKAVAIATPIDKTVTSADLSVAIYESAGKVALNGTVGTDASGGLSAVLAVTVKGKTVCVGINFGATLSTPPISTGIVNCKPGASPPSASSLYTTAMHNAESASWVHETELAIYKKVVVLAVSANVGTSGSTQDVISGGGGYADLIAMSSQKKMYEKGNAKGYAFVQPSSKVPAADYNKWILLTPGDPSYANAATGSTISTDFKQYRVMGTLTVGPLTTLHGIKVWPVHGIISQPGSSASGPGTLYVTATGKEWPLAITATLKGVTVVATWASWNKPATIHPPSGALSGAGI